MTRTDFPSYADLLRRTDAPAGSSWGLFGTSDELGTLNFISEEAVRRAAQCVKRGVSFNLDWPLNAFDPPLAKVRKSLQHTIFQRHGNHRDDYLDSFYMQSGSQIDGLRHARHAQHGFYNHTPDDAICVGSPTLGVNRWADHGMVGRGVVIDLERHRKAVGRPIDHRAGEHFPVADVVDALDAQKTRLLPGDIVLLRTGWCRFFFDELDAEERLARRGGRYSGLAQDTAVLSWVWDARVAVLATDNVAVEALPASPASPFAATAVGPDGGMLHPSLIALLGVVLGELWSLDKLADDCAADGVYDCLLTAKPLNLTGGVGSPANAVAIK